MAIIGRVDIQPAVVRPGETVRVEVLDIEGNPFDISNTSVMINGVPGAIQFLQFPIVGQRRLTVWAFSSDGETDQEVTLLDVKGTPLEFDAHKNGKDIALISVTQLQTQPYIAVLTLGSFIDARSPKPVAVAPAVSPFGKVYKKNSRVSRLEKKGVLGRAMADNPQMLLRSETRRLTNTRRNISAQKGKASYPPVMPRRLATGTVYDFTNIDLSKYFPKETNKPAHEYEWDFGDGNTATTAAPMVNHDYFASIDHGSGLGQFVVTCRIKHSDITVKRTLSIGSAYALCKATGTVVPHVTADVHAHKLRNIMSGMFTVHNVEDLPIVLDKLSVVPITDDGDAIALSPFVDLDQAITIHAKSISMVGVNVPFVTDNPSVGELRFDVTGFSVIYAGKVGDYPVRCRATFDVPVAERSKKPRPLIRPPEPPEHRKPWPWEIVKEAIETLVDPNGDGNSLRPGEAILDEKTGTLAISLGSLEQINRPHSKAQIRDKGLRVLSTVPASVDTVDMMMTKTGSKTRSLQDNVLNESQVLQRNITFNEPRQALGTPTLGVPMFQPPPFPVSVAEGKICDPENLTEEERELAKQGQLVCQLTDEVKDVIMPARWANAQKGDCILSPGGDGIIGGLLVNVNQWYSHCGIMTRNYDEIAHSTGNTERLYDHMIGFTEEGSDGFEPSVLKWMWPGAVRQTVQASIEGEDFPDPEYNKTYKVSAFGPHEVGVTHNNVMKMIPPLVLMPDPMQETPALRATLHAIASDAVKSAGRPGIKPKYHYRFYCYTDPTIGLGGAEGPAAGWAAGTLPSVCSSYIWMHAKARNAHLETDQAIVTPTDLEPEDVAPPESSHAPAGAAVRPNTRDGLYTYFSQQRLRAAEWLFDYASQIAFEKAGWFGEAFTDAADDVGNQIVNAFANDDAEGKDSEAWKTLGDADAVSPDNMLWWDGPTKGGLYGFAEPAHYHEPRPESYTVSRWKKVLSRGTLRGRVFNEAGTATVAGARVILYDDPEGETLSANDGTYVLHNVPLGLYQLKASKSIEGVRYSNQVRIDLKVADMTVDVRLQAPSDRYRIAEITVDFWGLDWEDFDDDIEDPGPQLFKLEVGPHNPENSKVLKYQWGGEIRVEYRIIVRLLINNVMSVEVLGKLYEETSEDNDDLDGEGQLEFKVDIEGTNGGTLTITNTAEDDDDAGVLAITVKNVRNDN